MISLSQENDRLRARVAELEAALCGTASAPQALGLSACKARILGVLMTREVATQAALEAVLYSERPQPPGEATIKVHIYQLRRKLAPHGIAIATWWGVGWRLSPEDKQRLRALGAPGGAQ